MLKRYFKIAAISAGVALAIILIEETAMLSKKAFAEGGLEEERAIDVKKSKEELMQSGMFYYKSKKYEAAVEQWEAALVIDPDNRKIRRYIKSAQAKLEKEKKREEKRVRKDVELISVTAPPKEAVRLLTLDDCINIAIKNHLPLQIAKKNITLGEMRVWEARRNLLPSLTAKWEEVYGKVNARHYYGKKEYLEGQQPIFHGGELYFTMKQTEVNLRIVKEEYNRIKNDLTLQVKKAYYTLAKAKENLRAQSVLKSEVEEIFDMVKKGFEGGAIAKLEFLNVSSQESQINFQSASAQGDVDIADLILKQAMNLDPKESIDIEQNLEFKKIDIEYENVLKTAFVNRPEMKINSMMVEYYKYEKKITGAKGWPKIDAMGSWGLAKEEFVSEDLGSTDVDQKLSQQWYAGIKASMPFWGSTAEYSFTKEQWVPVISTVHGTEAATQALKINLWDSLKYYSDKQAADIDFDRARQEFNKIKQDITLEAREGCFSYEKALIQLDTALRKVTYQGRDLELIRLKRGMDEAQDSTVIDSMIKLAQEKFGYIQALTDCHTALASINKAIGVNDYFKVEAKKDERQGI